jgi:hypothetical protein
MTLLITVSKKHKCNVAFINVISKVVITKVFISIVIVSCKQGECSLFMNTQTTTLLHSVSNLSAQTAWQPMLPLSVIPCDQRLKATSAEQGSMLQNYFSF